MEELSSIKKLLDEVAIISRKHNQIDQSTGRCFNIFDITNIAHKELEICRVIHELINPKGRHYQKGKYLKLFCENVLKIQDFTPSIEQCNAANVRREHLITGDRRIDLFIEIADRKIPIEVKIYAEDQEKQCYDYSKGTDDSIVYYLTLDRHEPSEESVFELPANKIICISFENEILTWIGECLKDRETIKLAPIRELLLQFDAVVRDLTRTLEEGKMKEITELLMQSSTNMKSAIEITVGIKEAREKITIKFLDAFHEKFKKTSKRLEYEYDYDKQEGRSACITYLPKEEINLSIKEIDESISLAFLINADKWDNELYVGFIMMKNDNGKLESFGNKEKLAEIRKHLDVKNEDKPTIHYVCYEYITFEDERINMINFDKSYKNYLNLFDSKKFDEIVDSTVKQAQDFFDNFPSK